MGSVVRFKSNLARTMSIFQAPFLPSHCERLTSLVAERQNRSGARASGSPARKPACSLLLVTVLRSMLFVATLAGLTVPETFAAAMGNRLRPRLQPRSQLRLQPLERSRLALRAFCRTP